MDKLKIQFGVDLLAKTLGLPEGVEIVGVKYDPMGHFADPHGTHVTVMIAGESLPTHEMRLDEPPESLNGLCKEFFE